MTCRAAGAFTATMWSFCWFRIFALGNLGEGWGMLPLSHDVIYVRMTAIYIPRHLGYVVSCNEP